MKSWRQLNVKINLNLKNLVIDRSNKPITQGNPQSHNCQFVAESRHISSLPLITVPTSARWHSPTVSKHPFGRAAVRKRGHSSCRGPPTWLLRFDRPSWVPDKRWLKRPPRWDSICVRRTSGATARTSGRPTGPLTCGWWSRLQGILARVSNRSGMTSPVALLSEELEWRTVGRMVVSFSLYLSFFNWANSSFYNFFVRITDNSGIKEGILH